jgi:hypothetical protein
MFITNDCKSETDFVFISTGFSFNFLAKTADIFKIVDKHEHCHECHNSKQSSACVCVCKFQTGG